MPVSGKKGDGYALGSDVLETYFPRFKGVAIADGWKSCRYFSVLQRCWSYPSREVEILALRAKGRGKKEEAEYLLSSLRSLFHETKSELKEHSPPNQKLHDTHLRKLRQIDPVKEICRCRRGEIRLEAEKRIKGPLHVHAASG
ncbi:MAG: hypothetical protein ACRDF4_12105 [Rhabdochlamydiaceae bacterium]